MSEEKTSGCSSADTEPSWKHKGFFPLLPVLSSQDKAEKLHVSLLTERAKRGYKMFSSKISFLDV